MGFDGSKSDRRPESTADGRSIDVERLSDALDQHPVRVGVLFDSHATGSQYVDSDVDVAVEFEPTTDLEDALLSLLADLSSATGGADVDVALLSDVDPRVGVSACRNGVLLVGDREQFESHCQRFRDELRDDRRPTRDRFHEIVETAKRVVKSDA